jgi:anti-sigma-K factor RskA
MNKRPVKSDSYWNRIPHWVRVIVVVLPALVITLAVTCALPFILWVIVCGVLADDDHEEVEE